MRRRDGADTGLLSVAVLAAVGLVAVPLVRLIQVVFDSGSSSLRHALHAPGLALAAAHSLALACVVPLLAVPLGTALALFLRRDGLACRGLLCVLVVLPLVIPQFVLGYSWTQAYDRAGFTDQLFGLHWSGLTGPAGIVTVLVVDAVPLSFLLSSAGLATRAAPEFERAARLSGAGGWQVLRTVTLPLLRPVLAAEAALIFVATLESFAVPQVLGAQAGFETITTRIYADLALASDPAAFTDAVTLALGLVLLAAVILLPADLLLAPSLRSVRTGQPAAAGLGQAANRRTLLPTAAVIGYSTLAVALPTVALASAALTRAVGLPPTPSNWTLDNFRSALDRPTLVALGHSVQLAAVAACVLTGLGALITALERRRAGRLLGPLAMVAFAIPGSTLAVGLLVAYGRWFDGSLALILLAYLAKFWALAHRTISGAADRLPPAEWQAARISGAGPATAARTVWLPALAPALLGAWMLVFLAALHEVTMSSLLYSGGNQTLAVAVLNSQELGAIGPTAALSVVLTALVLVAALPAWWLLRTGAERTGAERTGAERTVEPAPALAVTGAW